MSPNGVRILLTQIYEPAMDCRLLMQDIAREAGHRARLCGNPESFKHHYQSTPPDVVLLTSNADDPHCVELIEYLQSHSCPAPVKILVSEADRDLCDRADTLKNLFPRISIEVCRKPQTLEDYERVIGPTLGDNRREIRDEHGGDENAGNTFAGDTFGSEDNGRAAFFDKPSNEMGILQATEAIIDLHMNADENILHFLLDREVPRLEALIAKTKPASPEETAALLMVAISMLERINEQAAYAHDGPYDQVLIMLLSTFNAFTETLGIDKDALGSRFFLPPPARMAPKRPVPIPVDKVL